jgi:hypothetical protein
MNTENIYEIQTRGRGNGFLLSGPNLGAEFFYVNLHDAVSRAIRSRPHQAGALYLYKKSGELIERMEWDRRGKLL